jgi:hypothetical protein
VELATAIIIHMLLALNEGCLYFFNGCSSITVALSLCIQEVVSSSPACVGEVKPKTFKIGSNCSFEKSGTFGSKSHGSFG